MDIEVGRFLLIDEFVHLVTLEPEVTGWYSALWNLIGCTLCVISMKTIESDSVFECVISLDYSVNKWDVTAILNI